MKHQPSALAFLAASSRLRHRTRSAFQAAGVHLARAALPVVMLAAGAVLVTSAMRPPDGPAPTPMAADPGPPGNFAWKGYNWEKQAWSGPPQFNEEFDAKNVSDPDSNGYVTLTLSNPGGTAPAGAEFRTTRHGFGYGTYTATVEKNINLLQKEVVWGCLFTYDPSVPPGYNEIDLCEASAWGGGGAYGQSWPVTQGHGYWVDATQPTGQGNVKADFEVADSAILTHKLIWEPGKLTFETYRGEGFGGQLVKRTILEGSTVPTPAKEAIHFNLWVVAGGGGSPTTVRPEKVTIRDFTFTPAGPAAATR